MSVLLDLTEGWTAELGPFTLYQDAEGTVQPLDSMTVDLELRDGTETLVAVAGTVRIGTPASAGKVYYKPAAGDLVAGGVARHTLRWKVTDVAGNVQYFPNGKADELAVWPK